MSSLQTGPSMRVPTTFIQQQFNLPAGGPGIGAGIAQAGLAIADALDKIRRVQNRRRLAEIEVENIDVLSTGHEEALKVSLEQDSDKAMAVYSQVVESRLNVLRGIDDSDLRDRAVSLFALSAARTGALLRSAVVRQEAGRMERSDEAFFQRALLALEAGTISVDEATDAMEARFKDGIGIYLAPEEAEIRTGQAREQFEIVASDAAKAGLLKSAVELTTASASAENQEQRDGLRVAFGAMLAEAVQDRFIDKEDMARRLIAFDATVKGKVLEEIASLRQQLQDGVALGDLSLIDRIATRAGQLPGMPQLDTLLSEIRRGELTSRKSIDGSAILLGIFRSGQPMPQDAPRDRGSRNGSYNAMRSLGVPLTIATDFFAQDGVMPLDLTRDVRALFDPDGSTFSIAEGIRVLQSVHQRDRDAARRLVAEDAVMKVALAAGVQGDAQMRQDAVRLLEAGTAKRRLAEIERLIAPRTAAERDAKIDVTAMVVANRAPAILDEGQRDLFAGLVRLEYLRGRLELGETETSSEDVASNAGRRASDSFSRIRNGLVLFAKRATVFYDPTLVGPNIRQFESAVRNFILDRESLGTSIFNRPAAPRTGMMAQLPNGNLVVPIFDALGVRKLLVFDTTELDARRASTVLKRGEEGFEDLARFIAESNRGASFDPLAHLRRQPGEGGFPSDSVVLEYLQTARDMLIGMELPESQGRQQAEILAERLARERGWSGLWEPEGE